MVLPPCEIFPVLKLAMEALTMALYVKTVMGYKTSVPTAATMALTTGEGFLL